MATVLLSILLALLGLLLLLVLLPFHVRAAGSIHGDALAGWARAQWAWGLLGFGVAVGRGMELTVLGMPIRLRRGRRRERQEPEEREGEEPEEERRSRRKMTLRRVRRLLGMGARLVGTLRLRLRVSGTVGTGDPADTAVLAGSMRALQGLPGVEIDLGWEWLEEQLDLELEGSARIWIAHLLVVAAGLLWVRENRAALWAMR